MKLAWVAGVILVALILQTSLPLTHLPLVGGMDLFIIIMVLFVCVLDAKSALAACCAAGLLEDAFSCSPFGFKGLVALLVCAVLLRLKGRIIIERSGCRFLLLLVAVWMDGVGGFALLKLLCGLTAPLPLAVLLRESLITATFGTLILAALTAHVRRRRLTLAHL